jgi:hypothetical protein
MRKNIHRGDMEETKTKWFSPRPPCLHGEKSDGGAALVLALLVVVCLSGIGLGMVAASASERQISANSRNAAAINLAASAVVEGVIGEVAAAPSWSPLVSGAQLSMFNAGAHQVTTPSRTLLNLDVITAEIQADAAATYSLGGNTPQWRLFGWGPLTTLAGLPAGDSGAYVAVWVADDPSDNDGNASADANGVIMLHGEAFGYGASRAAADVVLKRTAAGPRVLSWRSR